MLIPYGFQNECLSALAAARTMKQSKVLVVMASGLGKTVTAALDVRGWVKKNNEKVLYLCHQNDILDQALKTFKSVIGERYEYGLLNGREKSHQGKHFLFSSFQTMRNWRSSHFKKNEFGYIVVDESHHGYAPTYRPTLNFFKPKFLLGITATPQRMDLQDIHQIYGDEIYSLNLDDALARGILTKVDYRLMTDEIQNLKILETSAGKMSLTALNKHLFIPKRDREIARIITKRMERIKNPRTIIFCRSIAYCEKFAKFLPGALPIHNNLTQNEQISRLDSFRKGDLRTVLTVDKFNEGIDIPEANIIVFLRSTSSPRIFYQQLGRGLRKFPGKEKVLVLDFVANCERLELIHDLWGRIAQQHKKYRQKTAVKNPLSVDVGNVRFTETAKKVLDVISRIRTGYSKEVLIKQLQDEAKRLGHSPTIDDITRSSRENRTASSTSFYGQFGSWNKALAAAGLEITQRFFLKKSELIQQIRNEGRILGRAPRIDDITSASRKKRTASPGVFFKQFGTWNAALSVAGYRPKFRQYSKQELIKQLRQEARRLGRSPTMEEINSASKAGRTASSGCFQKVFGTWNKALEAANLKITMRQWNRKELIRGLINLKKKLGRTPTMNDLKKATRNRELPTSIAFNRMFGGWNRALRASNLETRRYQYSRKELLSHIRAEYKKIGRTPSLSDMARAGRPSQLPYRRIFGSWQRALSAAGVKK